MKSELKDLKVSLFGLTNIQNAPKRLFLLSLQWHAEQFLALHFNITIGLALSQRPALNTIACSEFVTISDMPCQRFQHSKDYCAGCRTESQ
jgi:hypothetical protein